MQKPERFQYGFLTERDEGLAFRHRDFRMERNLMEDFVPFSRAHRQDCLPNLDRSWGENTIPEETTPRSIAAPVHHKVLQHAYCTYVYFHIESEDFLGRENQTSSEGSPAESTLLKMKNPQKSFVLPSGGTLIVSTTGSWT